MQLFKNLFRGMQNITKRKFRKSRTCLNLARRNRPYRISYVVVMRKYHKKGENLMKIKHFMDIQRIREQADEGTASNIGGFSVEITL